MIRGALLAFAVAATGCAVRNFECEEDRACDRDQICARDHACTAAEDTRAVIATWTINGEAPSALACADRFLYIQFYDPERDDTIAFSPVGCAPGQFSLDKLPLRFTSVELGVEGDGERDRASFDANDRAQLDLALPGT